MVINLDDYRMKKLSSKLIECGELTRQNGIKIANSVHQLAYEVRMIDSQIKANEKNNNRLKS